MTSSLRIAFLSFSVFCFGIHSACAAPLTAGQVKRFVASMPAAMDVAKTMKQKEDQTLFFKAMHPDPGDTDFAPYTKGMANMKKEFPADYQTLAGVVSKYGFDSQETWAAVGDDVLEAYMAVKLEDENPSSTEDLEQVTPEAIAMMPPEIQARMKLQVEKVHNMMQTVRNVPPANRDAVRPYLADIEKWGNQDKDGNPDPR